MSARGGILRPTGTATSTGMPRHIDWLNSTMTFELFGFIQSGSGLPSMRQPQMKCTQGSTGRLA
jgi:hypothetical protein